MRWVVGLMAIGLAGRALAQGTGAEPCPVLLEGDAVPGGLEPIREALRGAGFVEGDPAPRLVVKLKARSDDKDGSDFHWYELCVSASASVVGGSGAIVPLVERMCARPKRSEIDERIAREQAAAGWVRANRGEFARRLALALGRMDCRARTPPETGSVAEPATPSGDAGRPLDAGHGAAGSGGGGGAGGGHEETHLPWWSLLLAGTVGLAGSGWAARRWIALKRSGPPAVFVCYAHEDNVDADPGRRWVARLREHLEPLVRGGLLRVWWDREIPLGARWDETIHSVVDQAFAAVVLVSPDSLASSYIMDRELPALVERLHQRQLTLLPVAVRPCNPARVLSFRSEATTRQFSLTELQWPHELDTALSEMALDRADEILRRIAARLAELAAARRTGAPT